MNTLRQALARASPLHPLRSRTGGFLLRTRLVYRLDAPAVAPKSSDSENLRSTDTAYGLWELIQKIGWGG